MSTESDSLIRAVEEGDFNRTRSILESATDPSTLCTTKGTHWYSAIHTAAALGNTDILILFISKGADVNSFNSWRNESPLHFAATKGHLNVAQLLISNGANVNVRDIAGLTPLHQAASEGHVNAASLLLASGADVNGLDEGGERPLHLAVMNNNRAVVELLLDKSAHVNSQNCEGNTPLHYAIETHNVGLVSNLMSHGARVVINNNEGVSCTDLAEANNFFQEIMASTAETEVRPSTAMTVMSTVTLQLHKKP